MEQQIVTQEKLEELYNKENEVIQELAKTHQIADAERLLALLHKRAALVAIKENRV